ncbi:TetR/AcrR family transcriptional regulator [Actinoplanes derwentensis]|uniref:Transcriptional regulator, TetR family n=1 Tax=Actinoplanes derwentensis TaxID=113562 RepID=A0A1H2B736_9ACTN|nr:TetR/AcrR family transcriptional regulator [Actinoplanes derwentensis]GID86424.1 TetR family transcriptional regulator [Actinoplanes derwentensis]SDT54008.1 transcriptional regulator, TetR family [Actinoplanes derwentensis]
MTSKNLNRDTRTELLLAAERSFAHKGYAAVGINEVLSSVGVPKGSFYHYFSSKDAFGEAVIARYFEQYLAEMDEILNATGQDWAARILAYFASWRDSQSFGDCEGKCLAVKLGAEVADMSEPMRLALKAGTAKIVDRLERAIIGAADDGSSSFTGDARATAGALYQLWLGASVMAKVQRSLAPLDAAKTVTHQLLGM